MSPQSDKLIAVGWGEVPLQPGRQVGRAPFVEAREFISRGERSPEFHPVPLWRALFEIERDKIVVYRILHRPKAY